MGSVPPLEYGQTAGAQKRENGVLWQEEALQQGAHSREQEHAAMGRSHQGASAAGASVGKMTVWKMQLRDTGHRLNCATFLQPLSRGPNPSCRGSAGQFLLLLSPKWGWGMDRLSGGVSTQSAAAAPSLAESVVSVLER